MILTRLDRLRIGSIVCLPERRRHGIDVDRRRHCRALRRPGRRGAGRSGSYGVVERAGSAASRAPCRARRATSRRREPEQRDLPQAGADDEQRTERPDRDEHDDGADAAEARVAAARRTSAPSSPPASSNARRASRRRGSRSPMCRRPTVAAHTSARPTREPHVAARFGAAPSRVTTTPAAAIRSAIGTRTRPAPSMSDVAASMPSPTGPARSK